MHFACHRAVAFISFFFHCPPSSTELRMGKNSSHCTTLTLQLHPHQGFCLSQTQTRPLVHPLSYKDKHVPYFVSHLSFPNLSSYLPQEPVYGGNPNHVTFKKIFVSLTTWILGGGGGGEESFFSNGTKTIKRLAKYLFLVIRSGF